MDKPPKCPKCGGLMDEGYLIERGHGNRQSVTTWVGGAPDWGGTVLGLKVGPLRTGERPNLAVSTFRCATCGYLESYAK